MNILGQGRKRSAGIGTPGKNRDQVEIWRAALAFPTPGQLCKKPSAREGDIVEVRLDENTHPVLGIHLRGRLSGEASEMHQ